MVPHCHVFKMEINTDLKEIVYNVINVCLAVKGQREALWQLWTPSSGCWLSSHGSRYPVTHPGKQFCSFFATSCLCNSNEAIFFFWRTAKHLPFFCSFYTPQVKPKFSHANEARTLLPKRIARGDGSLQDNQA